MSEEQGGETTRRKRKSGWATTDTASSDTQLPEVSNSDSNSNSNGNGNGNGNSSSGSSGSSSADNQQYIPAAQASTSSMSTSDQQKLEQLRLIAEQKAASLQQNYLQKQQVAGVVSNPMIATSAAVAYPTPSSVVPGSGAIGLSAIPLLQPSKMSKEQKIDNRIYVGSLYYELTEADVKTLFGSFGTITHIEMPLDPITRRSRGYCFVEFLTEDEATQAQVQMNGFIVAGRPIKTNKPYNNGLLGSLGGGGGAPGTVSSSSGGLANPAFAMANQIKGGHANNSNNLSNFNNPAVSMLPLPALSPQNTIIIRNIHSSITLSQIMTIFDKFGEITTLSWSPSALPSTKTALIHFESPNVASAAASTFNNYEMFPGFPFIIEQPSIPNQNALPMMMSAPASLHVPAVSSYNIAATTTMAPVSAVSAPQPQQKCSVLLENMITLEEVDDPLLEGEVREEGEKFGVVKKIAITTTTQGNNPVIILTYARPEDAALAQSKLHNRPFGGRMVVASLI